MDENKFQIGDIVECSAIMHGFGYDRHLTRQMCVEEVKPFTARVTGIKRHYLGRLYEDRFAGTNWLEKSGAIYFWLVRIGKKRKELTIPDSNIKLLVEDI